MPDVNPPAYEPSADDYLVLRYEVHRLGAQVHTLQTTLEHLEAAITGDNGQDDQ